jgi:hypothetical protein
MIFVNNNCACSINGKDDEPMKEQLTKRGRATMSLKTWEATSSHTTGEGGPSIRSFSSQSFLPPCLLLMKSSLFLVLPQARSLKTSCNDAKTNTSIVYYWSTRTASTHVFRIIN